MRSLLCLCFITTPLLNLLIQTQFIHVKKDSYKFMSCTKLSPSYPVSSACSWTVIYRTHTIDSNVYNNGNLQPVHIKMYRPGVAERLISLREITCSESDTGRAPRQFVQKHRELKIWIWGFQTQQGAQIGFYRLKYSCSWWGGDWETWHFIAACYIYINLIYRSISTWFQLMMLLSSAAVRERLWTRLPPCSIIDQSPLTKLCLHNKIPLLFIHLKAFILKQHNQEGLCFHRQ